MPLSGPLRLPSGDGRSRLLQISAPLLDTTMDQLRTLLVVYEEGTALGAARVLGREQSSVQKQLDTLNRNFRRLCGEALVLKQGRGKKVLFTGSGLAFVETARRTLGDWLDGIDESRRLLGETLTVGTTRSRSVSSPMPPSTSAPNSSSGELNSRSSTCAPATC